MEQSGEATLHIRNVATPSFLCALVFNPEPSDNKIENRESKAKSWYCRNQVLVYYKMIETYNILALLQSHGLS